MCIVSVPKLFIVQKVFAVLGLRFYLSILITSINMSEVKHWDFVFSKITSGAIGAE